MGADLEEKWMEKKNKKPVLNKELVEEVYLAYECIKSSVSIQHVPSHSGIEGNELADKLANWAITTNEAEFARFHED